MGTEHDTRIGNLVDYKKRGSKGSDSIEIKKSIESDPFDMINVAVGVPSTALAREVQKQGLAFADLHNQNDQLITELDVMRATVAELSTLQADLAMQKKQMDQLISQLDMFAAAEHPAR